MNLEQLKQIQAAQLLANQGNNPSNLQELQRRQQQQLATLSQMGLLSPQQLQAIQYAQSLQQQQQQQQQPYPQQQYQQPPYQQQYQQQYTQPYQEQEQYPQQQYQEQEQYTQEQQPRQPYQPAPFHVYVNGVNCTPGAPQYNVADQLLSQKGGIIKINNPHRGPNNSSRPPIAVYARFFAQFSDGTKIGFLPDRYMFAVNGVSTMGFSNHNIISFSKLPVRPIQCPRSLLQEAQPAFSQQTTVNDTTVEQIEKVVYIAKTYSGFMTKLGWKRNLFGQDSWQKRYFTLSATHLTYSPKEFDHDDHKKHIPLSRSSEVQVVNRYHNALKNRYEGEVHGTDGPIGLDNVIELQCPNYGRFGRTFYFIADNLNQAQEWADIIQNNIRALPEDYDDGNNSINSPQSNDDSSGGFFSNAFGALGGALSLMANQGDLENPSKSYEFIRKCLNNTNDISDREVMLTLCQFFNELEDEL